MGLINKLYSLWIIASYIKNSVIKNDEVVLFICPYIECHHPLYILMEHKIWTNGNDSDAYLKYFYHIIHFSVYGMRHIV